MAFLHVLSQSLCNFVHIMCSSCIMSMPDTTFNREVDAFCRNVSCENPRSINVEMRERDGFRCFPHGVTGYVLSEKRIDGGWHISIARHFRLFLCKTTLLRNNTKKMYAEAYSLLFSVHASLRLPVLKTRLGQYSTEVNDLLHCIKTIAR
jgi:hypothetical protein